MDRTKKVALGLGASALLVGGGVALTSQSAFAETPTTTPSASASASPSAGGQKASDGEGRHGRRDRGGRDGELAETLAQKLGLKEADVSSALDKARESTRAAKPSATATPSAGTDRTRPDRATRDTALAKALATELTVDEAKVTAALEEIRAEHEAEHKAALQSRLDEAVKAGKLTDAEADAVVKAAEAGVIGYGGRR